jgi:hypothetical protein
LREIDPLRTLGAHPTMSIAPDAIEIGRCYLTDTGKIRRPLRILPDGRVQFDWRAGSTVPKGAWRTDVIDLRSFAFSVERPVPCDWTPERDE